jgi:antitoxin Phd
MKTQTATYAKTNFGRVLDDAARGPVLIQKSGRCVAVLLSFENYERLSQLEDQYWINQAKASEADGFAGAEASQQFLDNLLNAQD